MDKFKLLSNNALKIIACIAMLCDHAGVLVFPEWKYPTLYMILRIIGRIAFPIFAYMLAEGCFYTRNKAKHFLIFLMFASIIQIVYIIFSSKFEASIMTVFLISICLIRLFDIGEYLLKNTKMIWGILIFILLTGIIVGLYFVNEIKPEWFISNYGFYGMVTPFVLYVVKKYVGMKWIMILTLGVLIGIKNIIWPTPYCNFAFISLLFLALYNEQRGKLKLKYFFYIFYPAHLALLYLIGYLTLK